MFDNMGGIFRESAMWLMDVLYYVVIGLFFVGVLWVILYYSKFNKKVIIRKRINGQNKIFYDKARLLEKEGILMWKLMRKKKTIPVPPDEAIEVDKKGKDFCEFYELESGEFVPLIDKTQKINEVQPFTSNQRQLLQGQFKKANLERGFKLVDYIGAITYTLALVIIIISLFVFYGDIAKPVLEMGDKVGGFQARQLEMQKEMNKMLKGMNELQSTVNEATILANQPRNITGRGVPN